jgi:hypothetical protein
LPVNSLVQLVVQFLVSRGVPAALAPLVASGLGSIAAYISKNVTIEDFGKALAWLREHGVDVDDPPSFIARIQAAQGLPARPQGEPVEAAPGFIDFAAEHKPGG